MISKTIIISANENSSGRGILTLTSENQKLNCKLRLYNINKLSNACKIGVYYNKKVYTSTIVQNFDCYKATISGDFDLKNDFYCAIVDTEKNNKILLSGGTYSGYFYNNSSEIIKGFENNNIYEENLENSKDFSQNIENFPQNMKNFPQNDDKKISESLKDNSINYRKDNENLIENDEKIVQNYENFINIDKSGENVANFKPNDENFCEKKCENCEYKKYFYEQNKQDINAKNFIKNTENTSVKKQENNLNENKNLEQKVQTILEQLVPQFDYIFATYPANEELNNLFSKSNFENISAKFVTMENSQTNYSLGAIYEQGNMRFICYAVKESYNTPAPEEIGNNYQWLPLDPEDPLSDGYYLVFQNAEDLSIVNI